MRTVTVSGCFRWLRSSAASSGSDTAAVPCTGLGRDVSTAHSPARLLADQLAELGFLTPRFDFLGTGESSHTNAFECLFVWKRSIHDETDWLHGNTPARRIVPVRLQFGAMLATLAAAARDKVAGLVLLEPVLRGNSYPAQVSVKGRLRRKLEGGVVGGLAVDELHLGGDTSRLMVQIDLRQARLGLERAIAAFSYACMTMLSTCAQVWSETGSVVARGSFLGLEALLQPPHMADESATDFTPILSWLQAALSSWRRCWNVARAAAEPSKLRPASCIGTLRLGMGGRHFGVLYGPEVDDAGHAAAIIGNFYGDPHHGYAHVLVEFGRRSARMRISSLRVDFAGLGDSISFSDDYGGEGVMHLLEADRTQDISAAIKTLTRLGYEHFVLHELCSGAYNALQEALADERANMVLLIELPWFNSRFEQAGPTSFALRGMIKLAGPQVRTFRLFTGGNVTLKPLRQHFELSGVELSVILSTWISVEPSFDHNLTEVDMRQEAADQMIDFLH